jgi:hypothetical protein
MAKKEKKKKKEIDHLSKCNTLVCFLFRPVINERNRSTFSSARERLNKRNSFVKSVFHFLKYKYMSNQYSKVHRRILRGSLKRLELLNDSLRNPWEVSSVQTCYVLVLKHGVHTLYSRQRRSAFLFIDARRYMNTIMDDLTYNLSQYSSWILETSLASP